MKSDVFISLRESIIGLKNKIREVNILKDANDNYPETRKIKEEILSLIEGHDGIFSELTANFIDDQDKTDVYVKSLTGIIDEQIKSLKRDWVDLGWEYHMQLQINEFVSKNREIFKMLVGADYAAYTINWLRGNFKYEPIFDGLNKEYSRIIKALNFGKISQEERIELQAKLAENQPRRDCLNTYNNLWCKLNDLGYSNLRLDYNKIVKSENIDKHKIAYLLYIHINRIKEGIVREYDFLVASTKPDKSIIMIPEITYCTDNTITVQGRTYHFPFDCYRTCCDIMYLKEELLKPTVSILTLQEYPDKIFDENLFAGYFNYAALISNIIETIVIDVKNTTHKGNKDKEKLFDFLVSECEKRALKFKPIETDTLQDKQAEFNPEEYAAKKMLQISEADKIKQKDREANTMNTREKLIDNNNYSPTIEDFKEKALIESLDTSNPAQYLKFLRKEKERYTNGKYYYQIHGNSKAESDLENAYGEILVFISSQIDENLKDNNLQTRQNKQAEKISIGTKLISHFSSIELIVNGNSIEGIKGIDYSYEWDVFNDERNEYITTINKDNAKLWLPTVKQALQNEDEMFDYAKKIVSYIDFYKKGKLYIDKKLCTPDEYKEMIRYCFVQLVTGYSFCNQMKIVNWSELGEQKNKIDFDKSCKELEISDNFIQELFKIIQTKSIYMGKVMKMLEGIINSDIQDKQNDNQQQTPQGIQESENDYTLSTITEYLEPFRAKMKATDYDNIATALKKYFDTGEFPKLSTEITVGKINKKSFGWALNNIYKALRQDSLPIEYLQFAKGNISTFKNVTFEETNYIKSNLYKYFTTKTQ